MGKGDKRSKKGKIWNNSYGNKRNRNNESVRIAKAKKEQKKNG